MCLALFGRAISARRVVKLLLVPLVWACLLNCVETKALSASSVSAFDFLPNEQIFGAEIQYFRLRGGLGRNIPRTKVMKLWAKALDAAKGAGMNMVSFYIPWDFHEPVEGKFDFDGTTDEDGDGNPDYPSRDVKTFIRMVKERGFKYIMVRPGPYINAEWGHLGFGAIPLWFETKYPDSHMRDPLGRRTKLFDYHDSDFLDKTKIWFKKVYENVIEPDMIKDKIIHFVQLDNETNFLWQSIFNHNYSVSAIERYRNFLSETYSKLESLNAQHRRSWQSWDDILPPTLVGYNIYEDQDWHRFQDKEIYSYLSTLRKFWEDLGVREPNIVFTLAESYNAASHGLLPNYLYRNDRSTGLATVNLYPKTEEKPGYPLFNGPFKADHDVLAEESASQRYFGTGNKWVLGPEVQGGWFRGTAVAAESRQQTYLTTIGHGMKALLVYYFHEGENWDYDWGRQQIQPFYDSLRRESRYRNLLQEQLPDAFWMELQKTVDEKIMVGFQVKEEMTGKRLDAGELYFDAPLDNAANPRDHYRVLRDIGQNLVSPHSDWLARAVSIHDPICFLKDVREHVASPIPGIDADRVNSEWAAGLIGLSLNANVNMKIVHWGIDEDELDSCQVIFHQDTGIVGESLANRLAGLMRRGHVVVNLLGDSLATEIGVNVPSQNISGSWQRQITYIGVSARPDAATTSEASFKAPSSPLFEYTLPVNAPQTENDRSNCFPVFRSGVRSINGYGCVMGQGAFYQLGTLFYDAFSSDGYTSAEDTYPQTLFLRELLTAYHISPKIAVRGTQSRVVAFARKVPDRPEFWITVKSGRGTSQTVALTVREAEPDKTYLVSDLLSGRERTMTGQALRTKGFDASLESFGSTVFWVTPLSGDASRPPA